MSRAAPIPVSTPHGPKNPHNEMERQQVNIKQAVIDLDRDPAAQVKKIQSQGTTLIGYDKDAPSIMRPPTTRR